MIQNVEYVVWDIRCGVA